MIVTGVGLPEEGGLNLNPCVVRFHANHIGPKQILLNAGS
ncbi:hypothetical protein LbDm2_2151 [Levilactobacillus brevis]|nr:hypothetical protein LbDm2_2151 [Levilactobacillus brevis]